MVLEELGTGTVGAASGGGAYMHKIRTHCTIQGGWLRAVELRLSDSAIVAGIAAEARTVL